MLNHAKTFIYIFLLIGAITTGVAFTAVDQNKGAKKMVIFGGKLGNVTFPHLRHQTVLDDCNKCHNLIPQSAGSIQAKQKQNILKKKQVMNQCRQCHREMAKSQQKAGPIKCKECHQKNKK